MKVSKKIANDISYLEQPQNQKEASKLGKLGGKVVRNLGKALKNGSKSIGSLALQGEKILEKYTKLQNIKHSDPEDVKAHKLFKDEMQALLELIEASSKVTERIGESMSHIGKES